MRVEVYRNLHNGKYSIRALEGPNRGLVVAHADEVWLDLPEFKVSQAGRERVLRERKKYVHAVVRGTLANWTGRETNPYKHGPLPVGDHSDCMGRVHHEQDAENMQREGFDFTYNPYRFASFVLKDHCEAIGSGLCAVMSNHLGCRVLDPCSRNKYAA